MRMSYEERAKYAATNQGLDPVVAALSKAGISNAVEQTGGFCMAVTVVHPEGTWGIVSEEVFYAGWYPGTSWHDGPADDSEESTEYTAQTLEQLVTLVSKPA